jgi:hypothetical protein
MKKFSVFYAIIALFTLLIFTTEGNCFAGSNDIKARMLQRKPIITKLKSAGTVGENNKGFLEFIQGTAKKEETTVAAENKDRGTVQKATSGTWLQRPTGEWYRK